MEVTVTGAEQNLVTALGLTDGETYQVQNGGEVEQPIRFEERPATEPQGTGGFIHPKQPPYQYKVKAAEPAFVWCKDGFQIPLIVVADPE